jgi:tetratricopeptide (TPR) repeat protein
MDLFSNILYIKENYGELANLAHRVFHNDKYRPESCCVIGNYYSLRGDHHKAVVYFKRAIKLDNRFLSAWTLMGHEYLEMKNTNAAIESYRTAVDIDPKDFRAWYGLGQVYEINQMYNYASHYFANAALSKYENIYLLLIDLKTLECGMPWEIAMRKWIEERKPRNAMKELSDSKIKKGLPFTNLPSFSLRWEKVKKQQLAL